MISYCIRFTHPHRHFISFEALFPHDGSEVLVFQLPSWRPGRYELGFFAKNIRSWRAFAEDGRPLSFAKSTRDRWEVKAKGEQAVRIVYEYYAAELNAGSTYLDTEQLYMNPVNCFFYLPAQYNQPYRIQFELPEAFEIACGLPKESVHVLLAEDFDQLADCPLIASASLKHLHYTCRGVGFRIWIQGEHRLDEELLLKQFEAFTAVQIDAFGGFPVSEYHFLFQFTPYFVRHGVEHTNSTVIAMGPVADFLNENWYERMLGISSHELYHTWNVKAIRPAEMQPYRFDQENYTTLGYVAEGVTTYYGDVMMKRANVITAASVLDIFSKHLDEHYENPGRFHLSVAASSVDTWLDGYVAGIPGRKVSIYNEGCLIAWICDLRIMEATALTRSLDDAMRLMYERFGISGKGYTEWDYRSVLKEVSGVSFDDLFDNLVHGTSDYTPYLKHVTDSLGLEWKSERALKWSESALGISVDDSGARTIVSSVVPDSPGDLAGLWNDDEIVTVNGYAPYKNIQQLLRMHSGREIVLGVIRKYRHLQITLRDDGHTWKTRNVLSLKTNSSDAQISMWKKWAGES
jgi:predicted metalloprotease with PDZ domain